MNRTSILAVTATLLAILCSCRKSPESVYVQRVSPAPDRPKLTLVSDVPLVNARQTVLLGDKALVAQNLYGMAVIDVSDPRAPNLVHHFPPEVIQPVHLQLDDDLLYIADRFRGLVIWKMSRVDSPTSLCQVSVPGFALNLALFRVGARRCVAIACGGQGITVIDVTNPKEPRTVGRYTLDVDFSRHITTRGTVGYLADNRDGGLKIIDLSSPENPRLVLKIALSGFCDCVTVGENHVFVGYRTRGISVLNWPGAGNGAQRAADAALLCRIWRTNDCVRDVLLMGDYMLVANNDYGLALYDVHNPGMPVLASECRTPSSAMSCTLGRGHVFASVWDAGLLIYRLDDEKPGVQGSEYVRAPVPSRR